MQKNQVHLLQIQSFQGRIYRARSDSKIKLLWEYIHTHIAKTNVYFHFIDTGTLLLTIDIDVKMIIFQFLFDALSISYKMAIRLKLLLKARFPDIPDDDTSKTMELHHYVLCVAILKCFTLFIFSYFYII